MAIAQSRYPKFLPPTLLGGYHLRICRPVGLSDADAHRVVDYVMARLAQRYDLRNIFDQTRYLLPTPPVPGPWRRHLLALGSGDPTRAICRTLVAEALQSVPFPILAVISTESAATSQCHDYIHEIFHIRDHSLAPHAISTSHRISRSSNQVWPTAATPTSWPGIPVRPRSTEAHPETE